MSTFFGEYFYGEMKDVPILASRKLWGMSS